MYDKEFTPIETKISAAATMIAIHRFIVISKFLLFLYTFVYVSIPQMFHIMVNNLPLNALVSYLKWELPVSQITA
jgi:hypothetical protein